MIRLNSEPHLFDHIIDYWKVMRVPYKKSTVRDVAERAGVSQSAVSHYINGRVSVCSSETAERIDRAIEELHFSPARALRNLGRQATNTIGVCVSMLTEDEATSSYTYLHRFWSGVGVVVDEQSYRIMHFPRSLRNTGSCSPFLDGSIDGLLISSRTEDKRLEILADAGLPTVSVVRSTNLPARCGCVVVDEEGIVDLAMSHFERLGHKVIGYMGCSIGSGHYFGSTGFETNDTAIKRYERWRRHMESNGQDVENLAVFVDGYDYIAPAYCLKAVDHWLSLPKAPTAIFCASDRHAMSLISAYAHRGITCPDDISVIGVDNEGAGADFDPPLTSVEAPVHETGRTATSMLINMIKGTGGPQRLVLPVDKLVVRGSTCPPRSR